MKRSDDFDVSDCARRAGRRSAGAGAPVLLDDGRRDPAAAHLALSTLAPGAVVDGALLFEADLGYQIDNMEALGVHVAKDGTTILTMMSDDNFSMLQRTILLQFTLVGE